MAISEGTAKMIAGVITKASDIKKAVFSDGKFSPKRAAIMILAFIVIIVSIEIVGVERVEMAVELLDSVSDAIGYD